ncbi:MAG: site-specific DNA-methyltransferase [candidate division WOR-3 bacterium]|nr:site-specific DNA-methyltransferase [candidate division WOR-3 bacterium]
MAKIEITKTELVWPGKYNEDGTLKEVPRVSLPFQVIERVNESRATREAPRKNKATLFDTWEAKEGDTVETGWRNKLIWGDNLLVMGSLLERFAGKVDLIYIDPPFATGSDFSFTSEIGEQSLELHKDQSAIEEKAYRDTWGDGLDSYLAMLYPRLQLARDLLSPTGSMYVHLGWQVSGFIRPMLDEVFGAGGQPGRPGFRNEIAWKCTTAHSDSGRYGINHQILYFYTKGPEHTWNDPKTQYDKDYVDTYYRYKEKDGRRFKSGDLSAYGLSGGGYDYEWKGHRKLWRCPIETMKKLDAAGKVFYTKNGVARQKQYLDEAEGMPVQTIWSDKAVQYVVSWGDEGLGFDTQKPEGLLKRIVETSSNADNLVADLFCGSGTTPAVAEKLGRRWIGCDLGRWAIHVTRKRLLGIEGCKPFDVLNLGKYERQYWQGVTFAENGKTLTERTLYEYLAFILKLYKAQPVAGMSHLHGKKGRAMVHIGAVDAPVTIAEIDAAIDECAKLKQGELHVLGWEWEMGLYDLMVEAAKKKSVKLLLLQIPREVWSSRRPPRATCASLSWLILRPR